MRAERLKIQGVMGKVSKAAVHLGVGRQPASESARGPDLCVLEASQRKESWITCSICHQHLCNSRFHSETMFGRAAADNSSLSLGFSRKGKTKPSTFLPFRGIGPKKGCQGSNARDRPRTKLIHCFQ
jgi:hypothetical protein